MVIVEKGITIVVNQRGNFLHALNTSKERKKSWIIDSRDSNHMTGDFTLFSSYSPCPQTCGNFKFWSRGRRLTMLKSVLDCTSFKLRNQKKNSRIILMQQQQFQVVIIFSCCGTIDQATEISCTWKKCFLHYSIKTRNIFSVKSTNCLNIHTTITHPNHINHSNLSH